MPNPYPLTYLRWVDSASAEGIWHPVEEMKSALLEVESVGWIVKETDEAVVIVPHYVAENEKGDGEFTIPKAVIRERRMLTRVEPIIERENVEGSEPPALPPTPLTDFACLKAVFHDLPYMQVIRKAVSGHHLIKVFKDSLRFEFTETGELLRMSIAQESLHSRWDQSAVFVNTSDDSGGR